MPERKEPVKRLPDSGNGSSISPLSPFPPVQSQTHEPTGGNGDNRQGKTGIEGGRGVAGRIQEIVAADGSRAAGVAAISVATNRLVISRLVLTAA